MGSGTVILGVIGNITAMIMFFSPLPTFWIIHKSKDTGRYSAFPYVCTLMNCLLWFFYGLPMISENNTLVLTINGAGIIIETCYLLFYLYHAAWPVKMQVLRMLVFVIAFCVVTFAITLGAFDGDARTTFLGSVNVIINTIMYASPLSVMKMVIKTKSVEYMPFMLSLCSFVNAMLWALYGVLKNDKFIIIPNALGVFLGALQLVLYAKYRKYKPPPGTFTEEISAAYTIEAAPSTTDLSDIITRGAADVSDLASKGGPTIRSQLEFLRPPLTTTPPKTMQPQPSNIGNIGPKEAAKPRAPASTAIAAPSSLATPGSGTPGISGTPGTATASPPPPPTPTVEPAAARIPAKPVSSAPRPVAPTVAAPQTRASVEKKVDEEESKASTTGGVVDENSKTKEKQKGEEAKEKKKEKEKESEEDEGKEKRKELVALKVEADEKAEELRRLQDAFDEDEYGTELETIFL